MKFHARIVWWGAVAWVALLSGVGLAVDGIAISVKSGGSGYPENVQGSIERTDIQNSRMIKSEIIYSAAEGFARMPCISQDGKQVCFFRDGDKLVNGQIVKGTTDYVSVMDITGANVTNLVELTGTAATNRYDYTQGGPDRFMDWPAGDWIYYQLPVTIEIWRVNAKTKANERVITFLQQYNLPYIGRFNLSSGGNTCVYGNKEMSFPDTSTRKRPGSPQGCNHTVSASGRFINGWRVSRTAHQWKNTTASDPVNYPYVYIQRESYNGRYYLGKGHSYVELIDWDWGGNAIRFGITWNDCFFYRHWSYMLGVQWLQDNIAQPNIGYWSELPRWAANSDKWLIHSPEQAQCLWNWADRQIVLGARNRRGTNQVNDAGDFWVKPPKDEYIGTHYEDHAGNWLPHNTKSTAPLPDYIRCPGLTTPHECALKYGQIVIMPQSVYNTIAMTEWGAAALIPDISTVVVQPGSSIELTLTNEYYDAADPIFGTPPTVMDWKIVGQGASVSPAGGLKTTLTTTSSFSACSVEVTISTGTITKSVRKLVSTQAVKASGPNGRTAAVGSSELRISSLAGGAVQVAIPGGDMQSVDVYRVDGARVFRAKGGSGSVTIPVDVLVKGLYVLTASHSEGATVRARWTVK